MGKPAFKYVAYGECEKCGKPIVRNAECTVAVCTCESAVEVPLKPTMLFRTNARLYKKIEKICDQFKIRIDEFVTELLDQGIKELKKMSVHDLQKLAGGSRK